MCFLCNDTKVIYTPAGVIITSWINDIIECDEDKNSEWMNTHNCPICSEDKIRPIELT